jgi:hypothetical protein
MSGSIDTSDILVVVDKGEQYNVNLQPPDQYGVSIQAGDTYIVNIDLPTTAVNTNVSTYYRVADYAAFAVTAATASFLGGASASIPWDSVGNKPTGLLSSSQQINELANVSASFATTSSYALNAGSGVGFPFSGSAIITGSLLVSGGNIIGTSSLARAVIGGLSRYVPLWTGSSGNELTSSIIYQLPTGIFIGYDTHPHTHSLEGETLAVHSGETGVKNVIYAHGTIDNDYRINIRNISNGVSASTNYKATSDVGNDFGGYVQFGINSSTYSRTDQIGSSLDAYLYATGSDLLIGNASPDKNIILFSGVGNGLQNARILISPSGSVGINSSFVDPVAPAALFIQSLNENTYNVVVAEGSVDNYMQFNLRNDNTGTSASADYVITADSGTETSNYTDMGMNNSQYSIEDGIGEALDGYFYTTGNNLVLGTATADKEVKIFAGGFSSNENKKLILRANNQHELSGSLSVSGSIRVLGAIINELTSSHAITASYAPTILPSGVVSSSTQVNYAQLQNIPSGIVSSSAQVITLLPSGTVSSSAQINTGSFSGSFVGTFTGTGSWSRNAVSASYAITASYIDGGFY